MSYTLQDELFIAIFMPDILRLLLPDFFIPVRILAFKNYKVHLICTHCFSIICRLD